MTLTPQDAEQAFFAARGRPAWGTRLGVGSFLTVELGDERPATGTSGTGGPRSHGEFHVWVYCSAWRIETPTAVLASSEDDRDSLEAAVRVLDGKVLADARVDSPSLSLALTFEDGTTLRTFSIFTDGYEHWMLYLPQGDVITAGPGTAVTRGT